MPLFRSFVVSAALAGSALAQVNPFVLYPQDPERESITCTSFVGRPDWNNAAEALVKIDRQQFRGVGEYDVAGIATAQFFGIYHWVADEDLSTAETYDIVVRTADANDDPDMSPAARFSIDGLTTPPSPVHHRGTWIMYDGFNVAGGVLFPSQQQASVYVGIGLPANPLWPATDGHSLFRADMPEANTGAAVGENPRAGAPYPTWAGRIGAPSFATPWTYILGPFVTSPNLHLGGIDPLSNRLGAPGANFGMNGLYPDVSGNPRSDGLMARVTDNLTPFAVVGLGASLGLQPPAFAPGIIGSSYIGDGANTISLAVGFLANGRHETPLAAPGSIPPALVGVTLELQAFVWDPNTALAEWTEAQAVSF